MRTHLNDEQIAKCLTGDGGPEESRHLAECEKCRNELVHFEEAVGAFRLTVQEWTSHERAFMAPPAVAPTRATRTPAGRAFRWSLASAALAMAVLIPVYRNTVEQERLARAAEDAL